MTERHDSPEVKGRTDRLLRMTRALVEAQVHAIPGLELRSFDLVADFGGATAALHHGFGLTAAATVDAWGPGLHRRQLVWRQNLNTALRRKRMIEGGIDAADADAALGDEKSGTLWSAYGGAMRGFDLAEIVEAYDTTLSYVMTLQRQLSAYADAHGYDRPLDPDSPSPTMPGIGHLAIPVPLLDLLLAQYGDATVATIRDCVRSILMFKGSKDDSQEVVLTFSHVTRAGMTAYHGVPAFWCNHALIGDARFDGTTLFLPLEVPHIIAASAVGRRIGEITTTGIASLDACVIDFVGISEQGLTEFDVTAPTVVLNDHPGIRPHL